MNKLVIGAVLIVVAFLGWYFFLDDTPKTDLNSRNATGEVVAVDLDGRAFDGPSLITIEADGEALVIAVPSMGLPLCEAFPNIASVDHIAVGDTVSVQGSEDENGYIVPCADATDYLRVTVTVRDNTLGYTFVYPKSPDGYVVLDDVQSEDANLVFGRTLVNREEYDELLASTEPREGPPAMQIRVYTNPQKYSAFVWPDKNPRESNSNLIIGEPEQAVVSGANASHYLADGLYATDTYVIANGEHVYVLTGAYLDKDSALYRDFQALVASFAFIQTPDQI